MLLRLQVMIVLLCAAYVVVEAQNVTGFEHRLVLRENKYILHWTIVGNNIHIAFEARTRGWAALGIGMLDRDHAHTDMILGDSKSGTITDRWSTSRNTPELDNINDITNTSVVKENSNWWAFYFTRPLDTNHAQDRPIKNTYVPLTGSYTRVGWSLGESDDNGEFEAHTKQDRSFVLVNFYTGDAKIGQKSNRGWINVVIAVGVLASFCLVTRLLLPWGRLWFLEYPLHIPHVIRMYPYDVGFLLLWAGVNVGYWFAFQETCVTVSDKVGKLLYPNLAFLLLPVAKNSVWYYIVGVPFERAVKYHRWLAYITVSIILVHSILSLWQFGIDGEFGTALIVLTNFTGFLATLVVILMTGMALVWVRRSQWELFYLFHLLFPIFLVLALIHKTNLILFMIPSVILWLIDLGARVWDLMHGVTIIEAKAIKNGSKLVVQRNRGILPEILSGGHWHFHAGQFAYLHITKAGAAQLHPISIASSPIDDRLEFYIRDGEGGWSHRLATAIIDSKEISMRITGPFGGAVPARKYNTVIICCAGSGATPFISVLRDLMLNPTPHLRWYDWNHRPAHPGAPDKVYFYWVCKHAEEVLWFKETFDLSLQDQYNPIIGNGQRRLEVFVHVTGNSELAVFNEDQFPYIRSGRPNWAGIIESVKTAHPNERKIGVLACGPAVMKDQLAKLSQKHSNCSQQMMYHEETYEF